MCVCVRVYVCVRARAHTHTHTHTDALACTHIYTSTPLTQTYNMCSKCNETDFFKVIHFVFNALLL